MLFYLSFCLKKYVSYSTGFLRLSSLPAFFVSLSDMLKSRVSHLFTIQPESPQEIHSKHNWVFISSHSPESVSQNIYIWCLDGKASLMTKVSFGIFEHVFALVQSYTRRAFTQLAFWALMPLKTQTSMSNRSSHSPVKANVLCCPFWTLRSYPTIPDCDLPRPPFFCFLLWWIYLDFQKKTLM